MVIQFDEAGEKSRFQPANSDELKIFLDRPESEHTSQLISDHGSNEAVPEVFVSENIRRIFVVEDVSKNYVGILGSRLRIPPIFFARHLLELSVLDQLEDGAIGRGSIQSFALPFFQFAKAPKVLLPSSNQALEELYRVKANATRHFAFPRPYGTFDLRGTIIEIESCFSYWSNTRNRNSWDGKWIRDSDRLLGASG
jgi:hypothetical protein